MDGGGVGQKPFLQVRRARSFLKQSRWRVCINAGNENFGLQPQTWTTMTTTAILNGEATRNDLATASAAPIASLARPAIDAEGTRPSPANPPRTLRSLNRLWLGALAEESRDVAPWERMALGLVIFSVALSVAASVLANVDLVRGWGSFVELVRLALT
jgi:hypothetical protein